MPQRSAPYGFNACVASRSTGHEIGRSVHAHGARVSVIVAVPVAVEPHGYCLLYESGTVSVSFRLASGTSALKPSSPAPAISNSRLSYASTTTDISRRSFG